jgi:hypothetical protein
MWDTTHRVSGVQVYFFRLDRGDVSVVDNDNNIFEVKGFGASVDVDLAGETPGLMVKPVSGWVRASA